MCRVGSNVSKMSKSLCSFIIWCPACTFKFDEDFKIVINLFSQPALNKMYGQHWENW